MLLLLCVGSSFPLPFLCISEDRLLACLLSFIWFFICVGDGLVPWSLEVHGEGGRSPYGWACHCLPAPAPTFAFLSSKLPAREAGKAPCPLACRRSCSGSHRSSGLPQHPECAKERFTRILLLGLILIFDKHLLGRCRGPGVFPGAVGGRWATRIRCCRRLPAWAPSLTGFKI